MYNEQLDKLIEMALTDGELTEKEKQILFKKAEAIGVDLDEFEMVLDAKLFELNKTQRGTLLAAAPKSDKYGDVRKCPSCGAMAETFATRCAECGTEFKNIGASRNIIGFFEKIDDIESTRTSGVYTNDKLDLSFSFGGVIKWLFFWWILLPLKLIEHFVNTSKPAKWSTTDSRKEDLILNYPIPVSREEILEFLTLSSSRITSLTYFNAFTEVSRYKNAWNKIWIKKIDQIYSKSQLAMKNDKNTFNEVSKIVDSAHFIIKSNDRKIIHLSVIFIVAVLAILIPLFVR